MSAPIDARIAGKAANGTVLSSGSATARRADVANRRDFSRQGTYRRSTQRGTTTLTTNR